MTYRAPTLVNEGPNSEAEAPRPAEEVAGSPSTEQDHGAVNERRSKPFRAEPRRSGITFPRGPYISAEGADHGHEPPNQGQVPRGILTPEGPPPISFEPPVRIPDWYDAEALMYNDVDAFFAPPTILGLTTNYNMIMGEALTAPRSRPPQGVMRA